MVRSSRSSNPRVLSRCLERTASYLKKNIKVTPRMNNQDNFVNGFNFGFTLFNSYLTNFAPS